MYHTTSRDTTGLPSDVSSHVQWGARQCTVDVEASQKLVCGEACDFLPVPKLLPTHITHNTLPTASMEREKPARATMFGNMCSLLTHSHSHSHSLSLPPSH